MDWHPSGMMLETVGPLLSSPASTPVLMLIF